MMENILTPNRESSLCLLIDERPYNTKFDFWTHLSNLIEQSRQETKEEVMWWYNDFAKDGFYDFGNFVSKFSLRFDITFKQAKILAKKFVVSMDRLQKENN